MNYQKDRSIKFNNSNLHSTITNKRGDSQEWKNFLSILRQGIIECQSQSVGKVMGVLNREYVNPYGQNPFIVDLKECSNLDELIIKIREYAETQTSLSKSTIERDIRRIKLMSDKNKTLYPIDFLNPDNTQFQRHMWWYKSNKYSETTGRNFYGLKERKEAFYLYLESCGIPKNYFPYRLPKQPQNQTVDFPNPDKAYDITTYEYYKNKELNWYWQFAHLYNFIVGPRAPSEMTVIRIRDIDFDNCIIKFRQPKLHNEIRTIALPKAFIKGKTRKSIKNFVDYHRNKFTNKHSSDYLFISPWTGKPFKPSTLGKHLAETGKQLKSNYYPYQGRHFCATGTLIKHYLEKHPEPLKATMHFMGHSRIKTTEKYTKLSELYFKKYPCNWFKRILKGKNNCRGKCVNKSKQGQKNSVSSKIPSRKGFGPGRGYWICK